MSKLTIKKLFIANRGEVCRRIASTARRLHINVATVLVEDITPVYLAEVVNTFVRPKPEIPNPYLDIDEMIRLAKASGSDAIHPGFGFLSENDDFARRCIKSGLTWVGPNPESIKAMASKSAAREIAEKRGVPVNKALQGIELKNEAKEIKAIKDFADSVGYPILIKAAYGGGGKGMRLVDNAAGVEEAAKRCHSEAVSSFGNGQLLVEKYIKSPRHVEVQILADKHKNVYAIGDRDCSIQRRHQKILEEAPAPDLNELTRKKLHDAAIQLAKSVGYDSAGTVEFLLDADADHKKKDLQPFYFLEMNTRLQVEHPVTEEVFGLDLVEQQLRVACGEKLTDYSGLRPQKWSIEARIYAEDPEQNYLPSPERVDAFIPFQDLGIRWEVGIDATDQVSDRFDPMIAKCIASGETRLQAFDRLQNALQRTILCGPKNNINFLRAILNEDHFRSGAVSTHYLQNNKSHIDAQLKKLSARSGQLKEIYESLAKSGTQSVDGSTSIDGITQRAFGAQTTTASRSGENRILETYVKKHKHNSDITVEIQRLATDESGSTLLMTRVRAKDSLKTKEWLCCDGATYHVTLSRGELSQFQGEGASDAELKAPVPGKIVKILTQSGNAVDKNQTILVLESMKMEFEVKSQLSATVEKILVKVGEQVSSGQTLVVWQH